MMGMDNDYRLIGMQAYRSLALRYHPDKNREAEAETKFKVRSVHR